MIYPSIILIRGSTGSCVGGFVSTRTHSLSLPSINRIHFYSATRLVNLPDLIIFASWNIGWKFRSLKKELLIIYELVIRPGHQMWLTRGSSDLAGGSVSSIGGQQDRERRDSGGRRRGGGRYNNSILREDMPRFERQGANTKVTVLASDQRLIQKHLKGEWSRTQRSLPKSCHTEFNHQLMATFGQIFHSKSRFSVAYILWSSILTSGPEKSNYENTIWNKQGSPILSPAKFPECLNFSLYFGAFPVDDAGGTLVVTAGIVLKKRDLTGGGQNIYPWKQVKLCFYGLIQKKRYPNF